MTRKSYYKKRRIIKSVDLDSQKDCLEDPKLCFGRRFSRLTRLLSFVVLLSFVAAILCENFNPCSGALPKIIDMNLADNHAVSQTNGAVPLCGKALGQPSLKPMVVRFKALSSHLSFLWTYGTRGVMCQSFARSLQIPPFRFWNAHPCVMCAMCRVHLRLLPLFLMVLFSTAMDGLCIHASLKRQTVLTNQFHFSCPKQELERHFFREWTCKFFWRVLTRFFIQKAHTNFWKVTAWVFEIWFASASPSQRGPNVGRAGVSVSAMFFQQDRNIFQKNDWKNQARYHRHQQNQ